MFARSNLLLAGLLGATALMPGTARADSDAATAPGIWDPARANLLGDIAGLRPWLGSFGATFNLNEVSEGLTNATGGIRSGAVYDGLTTATFQLDTGKAFGLNGGTFNVSALQYHGRGLSSNYLLSLDTSSGIEAERATRLWELWYDQQFFGGTADVKLGQQSVDQEFITSQGSATFMNTMFGWPAVPSYDLNGGGPAYPLSAPGVRLRVVPNGDVTILAGVFDDDPGGGAFGTDSQALDASGARFSLRDGTLAMTEIQYAVNQPTAGESTASSGLPGTYKLGFWYDSGTFQNYENGAEARGDYSIYAVADQMIWRPDPQSPQSLNFFTRLMGSPRSDRNFVDLAVNAGFTLKAPFKGRDSDTAGLAYGYTRVGSGAAAASVPTLSAEQYVELTYQYQAAGWWVLQPDFQYIFNPGAGVDDPNTVSTKIGNEAVFALRTTVTF